MILSQYHIFELDTINIYSAATPSKNINARNLANSIYARYPRIKMAMFDGN
jgi:hypothetical protein